MATPSVAAALDKADYLPGELMTLTVSYFDSDSRDVMLYIVATDQHGNQSEPVEVVARILDEVTVTIIDDEGRMWQQVSDTGSVAVFTALA